jgi:hypothetical protein
VRKATHVEATVVLQIVGSVVPFFFASHINVVDVGHSCLAFNQFVVKRRMHAHVTVMVYFPAARCNHMRHQHMM